jgi:integrase
MLADAAEAGDIRQNPARGVRIGNLTKSPAAAPVKALKPSEAATLIAALPDPYRLLVRFLLETGLRISEVAALRWSDVDFAAHRVRVERRYRDGRLGPPKSNAGRRVVPLPAPTSRLLLEARKTARNASDEGLVSPGRTESATSTRPASLDGSGSPRRRLESRGRRRTPADTPARVGCSNDGSRSRRYRHGSDTRTLRSRSGSTGISCRTSCPAVHLGTIWGRCPPKPAETSGRRTTPNTAICG